MSLLYQKIHVYMKYELPILWMQGPIVLSEFAVLKHNQRVLKRSLNLL